jgi:hypothetical protein
MMTVIFILGVLGAVMLSLVPFMQEKSRDRRRVYELSNLKRQIELYKNETGNYPNLPDGGGSYFSFFLFSDGFESGAAGSKQVTPNYVPNLVPQYYQELPMDPYPGSSSVAGCNALGYQRNIAYFSNGDHYKLVYNCASETNDYYIDHPFQDPTRPFWAWAISDNMDYAALQGW